MSCVIQSNKPIVCPFDMSSFLMKEAEASALVFLLRARTKAVASAFFKALIAPAASLKETLEGPPVFKFCVREESKEPPFAVMWYLRGVRVLRLSTKGKDLSIQSLTQLEAKEALITALRLQKSAGIYPSVFFGDGSKENDRVSFIFSPSNEGMKPSLLLEHLPKDSVLSKHSEAIEKALAFPRRENILEGVLLEVVEEQILPAVAIPPAISKTLLETLFEKPPAEIFAGITDIYDKRKAGEHCSGVVSLTTHLLDISDVFEICKWVQANYAFILTEAYKAFNLGRAYFQVKAAGTTLPRTLLFHLDPKKLIIDVYYLLNRPFTDSCKLAKWQDVTDYTRAFEGYRTREHVDATTGRLKRFIQLYNLTQAVKLSATPETVVVLTTQSDFRTELLMDKIRKKEVVLARYLKYEDRIYDINYLGCLTFEGLAREARVIDSLNLRKVHTLSRVARPNKVDKIRFLFDISPHSSSPVTETAFYIRLLKILLETHYAGVFNF